ncbi:MAG TPA: RES family NAD+ phosphorylase [Burkholderiales bacterium]|nr:RES family NAD+ phosphorylase [Burkholderiales bacterium]
MKRPCKAAWFATGVQSRKAELWRGVEAQHVISSMRLVDSVDEQRVLEELLESSKPALPAGAGAQHYLIFTPFRYRAPLTSRFSRVGEPGLWYGAEELETALAEVAYWKWRFLMDSAALAARALLTQHTFFRARVHGACVDLTLKPWNASERDWRHRTDYAACQSLSDAARAHDVAWIRYASARAPGGVCGAVLKIKALSLRPAFAQQTWACKTTRDGAYLQQAGSAAYHAFFAHEWV